MLRLQELDEGEEKRGPAEAERDTLIQVQPQRLDEVRTEVEELQYPKRLRSGGRNRTKYDGPITLGAGRCSTLHTTQRRRSS